MRARAASKRIAGPLTRPYIFAVASLFAVAFGLRAAHLADGIRYDEAYTFLDYASKPLGEAVTLYTTPNNHLLNTILVKAAATAVGDKPPRWRWPNLLAGLGAMALTAALAARHFGRLASLVALAVVAVSPPFAHYAVLARGYVLAAFFALAALYVVEKLDLDADAKLRWWLPLCAALSIYAVPVALVLVMPVAAYDLFLNMLKRPRGTLRWATTWAAAAAIATLLYLPPLVRSGWEALTANAYISPVTGEGRWARLGEYGAALVDEKSWGLGGVWVWGPLTAAGIITSAVRSKRFAFIVGAVAAAVGILTLAGVPPPTRTFALLVPLVAIGVGGAVGAVASRLNVAKPAVAWPASVVLVAAALLCAYGGERRGEISLANRAGRAPGARDVAAATLGLKAASRPIIINCPYNCPVFYHLRRSPGRAVRFMFRPPRGYTKNVYVVVPAGSTVKAEVETCLGPGWVAHDPRCVRRAGPAGIWEVTVVSVEQSKRPGKRTG